MDFLNIFFSDLTALSPQLLVEMFSMFAFFELIGIIFSWTRGVK